MIQEKKAQGEDWKKIFDNFVLVLSSHAGKNLDDKLICITDA